MECPYRWKFIKFTLEGEVFLKVFSGMQEGYSDADTWRMSSVVEVISPEGDDILIVRTASGNTYDLVIDREGFTSYMYEKFEQFLKLASHGLPDGTSCCMEEIGYEDAVLWFETSSKQAKRKAAASAKSG